MKVVKLTYDHTGRDLREETDIMLILTEESADNKCRKEINFAGSFKYSAVVATDDVKYIKSRIETAISDAAQRRGDEQW